MAEWPLRLERRPAPSQLMRFGAPLFAALAMLITGACVFAAMGQQPFSALYLFFVDPLMSAYGMGELLLKATPLMLCALGLAHGFRANVWNIGAEGQLTLGAIAGGGVALFWGAALGKFALPVMLCAGVLGGMAWAAIPAVLRTRFNTSEILVESHARVHRAVPAGVSASRRVAGPGRIQLSAIQVFEDSQILPTLAEGMRANVAFILALVLAGVSWIFSTRTFAGYRMLVAGLAPAAASYAGFSEKAQHLARPADERWRRGPRGYQ